MNRDIAIASLTFAVIYYFLVLAPVWNKGTFSSAGTATRQVRVFVLRHVFCGQRRPGIVQRQVLLAMSTGCNARYGLAPLSCCCAWLRTESCNTVDLPFFFGRAAHKKSSGTLPKATFGELRLLVDGDFLRYAALFTRIDQTHKHVARKLGSQPNR